MESENVVGEKKPRRKSSGGKPIWLDLHWIHVLRLTGWSGVVGSWFFWALTDRLSPEILASAGLLAGTGELTNAIKQYASSKRDDEE